jgi:hypothetical protein
MAERIIRQLIDDLDQTEIADGKGGPVEFAFRGTVYRIDLSDGNAAKLEKALAPFVASATRVSGPRGGSSGSTSVPTRKRRGAKRSAKSTSASSTAAVRAWAAENGHAVSARGRIPASVLSAYEVSHKRGR